MLDFLIKRRITTLMLFAAICLWGIISVFKLPLQMLPDIEFAKLTVITPYENAAPSEVEKLITKNIEETVTSVNGVVSIYSESIEGLSIVTAQFKWGTNMDLALIEMKEKVDMIKGQLPEDTGKSIVMKFDPKADPVAVYAFVPKGSDAKNARKRIEKEIIPYLERIDGVAVVDVSGGYRKQVNINLDSAKLYAHNLSLKEVMQGINVSNYSFPAGYVSKGSKEYMVRTTGEFENIKEIGDSIVGKNERSVSVHLRDIAEISDSYKDRKCINRFSENESIGISIRKEPGKNVINICAKIEEEIKKIQEKQKGDFEITKIYDQSDFVQKSIRNLEHEAIQGAIISIIVIFFFLREFRAPLIIISSIPISILGTFSLMYFKGITLNTMSLGGLALCIGMIVDAGTVIVQSILEAVEQNQAKTPKGFLDAVVKGTKSIAGPIFASTLCSIVVFLPIVFISGMSGAIFGELALTISFSLMISFFAAVTLVPMLYSINYSRLSNSRLFRILELPATKFFSFAEAFMIRFTAQYKRILKYGLENPVKIFVMGIVSTLIGLALFFLIDFELMPKVEVNEFTINVELPKGTPLETTSDFSGEIEHLLLKKKYVRYVYSKIGSDPEENIIERTSGKSTNNISLQVILKHDRDLSATKIIDSLKKEISYGEGTKIDFEIKEDIIAAMFAQKQKPLTIQIYGEDREVLKHYGTEIITKLSKNPAIINISSLLEEGYPEFKIVVDRDRMSLYGVTIEDIASTLRSAINGEVATKYRTKDDEFDIRVRLRKDDRHNKDSISQILMKTDTGKIVPLSNFISIEEGIGPNKIVRSNQSRVNIIAADIKGSRKEVYKDAEAVLSSVHLGEGYQAKIVGEKDEIFASLKDMGFAFILSIVLIYMLLAAQFQSFTTPILIMISIPVASLGVSLSLLLTGKTLNINSCIGIILLAGHVVNNSIILYDIIGKELPHTKDVKEAIINAGGKRLGAILNTSLTAILGMVPIALGLGEGTEIQQPLAVTVIGGLTFSTFLTLVFIPTVFYVITNKRLTRQHGAEQ